MNQLIPSMGRTARVLKVLIRDVGTYEDQFARPYESVIDPQTLRTFENLIDTRKTITPSTVAQALCASSSTNNVLQPQAEHGAMISIPGGWNSRRLAFIILFEYDNKMENSMLEVVTGFTDYRGLSFSGAIDPQMVFYINNSIKLRVLSRPTPYGVRTGVNVTEASQLVSHDGFRGPMSSDQLYRMRPTDVFGTMDLTMFSETLAAANVTDGRTLMTEEVMKSNRQNNVPTNYVASLFESYRGASLMNYQDVGMSEEQILTQAADSVREFSLSENVFERMIAHIRGVPQTRFFTWSDLTQLDQNVNRDEVCMLQLSGSAANYVNMGYNQAGMGADWRASNRIVQVATILGQAVPSILMRYGLIAVQLTATNRTLDNSILVTPANAYGIASMAGYSVDNSQQIEAFRLAMVQEILQMISYAGEVDFLMTLNVDLTSETTIDLEYNNNEHMRFIVPSFADSFFTPIVAHDYRRPYQIASQFHNALGAIFGAEGSGHMVNGMMADYSNSPSYDFGQPTQTSVPGAAGTDLYSSI